MEETESISCNKFIKPFAHHLVPNWKKGKRKVGADAKSFTKEAAIVLLEQVCQEGSRSPDLCYLPDFLRPSPPFFCHTCCDNWKPMPVISPYQVDRFRTKSPPFFLANPSFATAFSIIFLSEAHSYHRELFQKCNPTRIKKTATSGMPPDRRGALKNYNRSQTKTSIFPSCVPKPRSHVSHDQSATQSTWVRRSPKQQRRK